jgi:hypothetical protein
MIAPVAVWLKHFGLKYILRNAGETLFKILVLFPALALIVFQLVSIVRAGSVLAYLEPSVRFYTAFSDRLSAESAVRTELMHWYALCVAGSLLFCLIRFVWRHARGSDLLSEIFFLLDYPNLDADRQYHGRPSGDRPFYSFFSARKYRFPINKEPLASLVSALHAAGNSDVSWDGQTIRFQRITATKDAGVLSAADFLLAMHRVAWPSQQAQRQCVGSAGGCGC